MLTSIWHIVMERAHHICDVLYQIHRLSLIMKIFSSVQSLSHVMPLWPHGLQHARFLLHQHLELVQTHVHQVSDAIQPSHPLSSPSLPAFNLSHQQGLFQWVSYHIRTDQTIGSSASASTLPVNIQDWFPLGLTGWISLQPKGSSRVFSNTMVQQDQFFGTQLCLWSNSHIHTWLLKKS